MISYVIPVYNQAATIADAIESAARCADSIGGEVVVAVNKCQDETPRVSELVARRWKCVCVIHAPDHLPLVENLRRGLELARFSHTSLLGGDDELPLAGQQVIAWQAMSERGFANNAILFGEADLRVGASLKRGTTAHWYRWRQRSRQRAQSNVLRGIYPNMNGTWIPRIAFMRALSYAERVMSQEYAAYAVDAAAWWWLSRHCDFVYCPTVSVCYRIKSSDPKTWSAQVRSRDLARRVALIKFWKSVLDESEVAAAERTERLQLLAPLVLQEIRELGGFSSEEALQLRGLLIQLPLNRYPSMLVSLHERWPIVYRALCFTDALMSGLGKSVRRGARRAVTAVKAELDVRGSTSELAHSAESSRHSNEVKAL